jgi:hypothetical protein
MGPYVPKLEGVLIVIGMVMLVPMGISLLLVKVSVKGAVVLTELTLIVLRVLLE